MPKFFFALEKKTLEAYRDSRNEAAEATPKMSSAEISEWKTELIKTANIRALPEEVESSNFQAPPFFTIDDNGTANIEVSGVLLNFVDFFDFFFDDAITTFGFIREAALRADEDPQVKKIRFNVSTGGGIITELELTSHVIANLNKPTETVGFGMVASAGIWLFSQTDKIIASDETVFFGSIGVAVTIIDRSKMREEMGIEIIELVNDDSPDKRPDLSTDEGRRIIVKELNDLFKIMVQRVADGRGTTVEDVKKNFGKGGVLIANEALEAGLIDQVDLQNPQFAKNKDKQKSQATEPAHSSAKRSSATNQNQNEETDMDPKTMTLAEFLAQNSGAKTEHEKALEVAEAKGKTDGIAAKQAEIDRIHPLISAEGASPALVQSGFEALKGVTSVDTFVGIASYETRTTEAANAAAADIEGKGDIIDEGTKAAGNGKIIKNQADLDQEKALFAEMKGKKKEGDA